MTKQQMINDLKHELGNCEAAYNAVLYLVKETLRGDVKAKQMVIEVVADWEANLV